MSSLNQVTLIGRLGRDPELRQSQSGTQFANMALATSEYSKDKDGNRQERTEWHRLVAVGKTAENCGKYLTKGSMICVQGRLQTRKWTDKDGVDRYNTEIWIQNVQFLTKSEKTESQKSEPPKQEKKENPMDMDPDFNDDDIPF